jgi:hypothetical protein
VAEALGLYPEGKLFIRSDPERVLVSIEGTPAITVSYFNRRLREFPVSNTRQSVTVARGEVLDQMISNQHIVREARKFLTEAEKTELDALPRHHADQALSENYIRRFIANPNLAGNPEAREFYEEDRDDFPKAWPESLDLDNLMLVKAVLLDRRWRDELERWRATTEIQISKQALESD